MAAVRRVGPSVQAKIEIGAALKQLSDEEKRTAFRDTLRALPGYPWIPCPICKGTESCDHIAAERAQAALPSLVLDDQPYQ